mmetsp:Transcript_12255/g.16035  ORF Transcript_12255/g.16035 Transcript_12255/m.16035 type:complete len:305 (-) Transcript_12255:11-925(-)
MPSSRLSRRKGSSGSRSVAGRYAICILVGVVIVLIMVGGVLYYTTMNAHVETNSMQNKENAAQHPINYYNIPDTVLNPQKKLRQQRQFISPLNEENEKYGLDEDVDPRKLPRDDDFSPEDSSDSNEDARNLKEILILSTDLGPIRITLKPEYSKETAEYIRDVVSTGKCDRCAFYRAESQGILQGIIKSNILSVPTERGSCPKGLEDVPNNCPAWDTQCGCHGPILERGYVAWAAGKTGPDFFIDDYRKPAKFWGTQHTAWGQIEDDQSLNVIQKIWTLPAKKNNGLTYLENNVKFTMSIIEDK